MSLAEGRIPPLSTQLIEALDKAYPARCIQKGESPEDAHRYAGARELIERLLDIINKPEDEEPAVLEK